MKTTKTNYCRLLAFLAVMLLFSSLSASADYSILITTRIDDNTSNKEEKQFIQNSEGDYVLNLDCLIENQSFQIKKDDQTTYYLDSNNFDFDTPYALKEGYSQAVIPKTVSNVVITLKEEDSKKTIIATGKDAILLYGNWNDSEPFINFNEKKYNAQVLKPSGENEWIGSFYINKDYSAFFFKYLKYNIIPVGSDGENETIKWDDNTISQVFDVKLNLNASLGWGPENINDNYYVKIRLDNDIEEDEVNGKFTISKVPFEIEKQEGSFVWRVDENKFVGGGSHKDPAIRYPYGVDNELTLEVRDINHQEALSEVSFEVRYLEPGSPNSTAPAEVNKRRADDDTDRDDEGYRSATEKECKFSDDKSTINFKAAGYYKITALIPSSENYLTTTSPLYLTVNQVKLELGSGQSQPFNAVEGSNESSNESANVFEGLIEFSSDLKYETDFTVSVEPDANNWISYSTTEGSSLEEKYNNAFKDSSGDLYNQLAQIGFGTRVDGFYDETELKVNEVTPVTSNDNYPFDLSVTVPCSGVYTVKVSPTSTNAFEEMETKISVYPNLYATFNKETGFNINGYMWVKNGEDYVITLPEGTNLKECVGFIPGTYFASSLTTEPASGEFTDPKGMVYRTGIMDLTRTDNGTTTRLTVNVSKNGASSPNNSFIFDVTTGDENNPSTGIDFIGIDSEEPVYFNLQGLRVENPERGIFIKVSNGKASKVVF